VRVEANEATNAALPKARPLGNGAFYAPDAVTHDTWLPSATALRAEQTALDEELGWVAIGNLASSDDRARLIHAPEGARALRLRDVGDDLLVSEDDDASEQLIPSRTLARTVVPGEVLLSTLGSSFRPAYVDEDAPKNTFPVDGWARLRFRETLAIDRRTALASSAAHGRLGAAVRATRCAALFARAGPTARRARSLAARRRAPSHAASCAGSRVVRTH
jgi:hypothetical protein